MRIRQREVQCYCGAPMVLRNSQFGRFYGCSRFPSCRGTHGARPDGTPLGKPADPETRVWRMRAHERFDELWRGKSAPMSRDEAYQWLRDSMDLSKKEGHIGRMDMHQCQRLILLANEYLMWGGEPDAEIE